MTALTTNISSPSLTLKPPFPFWKESPLAPIAEKIFSRERLTREEGYTLMKTTDLATLGLLADWVREERVGPDVYFNTNFNLNHTNVCAIACELCAFAKKKNEPDAYTFTVDQIEEKLKQTLGMDLVEVHIVGGLHTELPFSYFEEMLQRIKRLNPNVTIKAFTAVEIDFFSKLYKMTIDEVIERLKAAGLDMLPGGGAEIFAKRVRKLICSPKISGERWLEVMEIVHGHNLKTNCTMLYGHVETPEERVDHMMDLRDLQDKTGGFISFVPLPFFPENTVLGEEAKGPTGWDDLRVMATARLLLDNIPHIKGLWWMLGPKLAQTALSYGVDDVGGTLIEEKIVHAAGSTNPQGLDREEIIRLVKEAGRIPVEVNSLYQTKS